MTDEHQVEIRDAPEEGAYVVEVDGARAGKAEYLIRQGRHVFTHTEIEDEFLGEGLATKLVRYALDDVRSSGGRVVPICPLFGSYLQRHPEYEEIVDHQMTMEIKKRQRRS